MTASLRTFRYAFHSIIVILLVVLYLPLCQMVFHVFPDVSLKGVVVEQKRPTFHWANWWNGSFQSAVDQWFNARFGFRGALVKTENQFNFSVFRQIPDGGNVHIVLGKDNTLFERGYIESYLGYDTVPTTTLEQEVASLRELQAQLKKRGVPFVLVISPNKATMYPELLPDAYQKQKAFAGPTNYGRIKPLLAAAGIVVVDGHELLQEQQAKTDVMLFPRGGTHWTYYGACLVSQKIIETVEAQGKQPLTHISCDPPIIDERPMGTDKDLSELINIWTEADTYGPTPHPKLQAETTPRTYRPHVVMVGDSFSWALTNTFERLTVYETRDLYYYYSRRSQYPSGTFDYFDKATFDWDKEIFSKDVVIIEANEASMHEIGFGFIPDALRALRNSSL